MISPSCGDGFLPLPSLPVHTTDARWGRGETLGIASDQWTIINIKTKEQALAQGKSGLWGAADHFVFAYPKSLAPIHK
jgi:hypothetical protein